MEGLKGNLLLQKVKRIEAKKFGPQPIQKERFRQGLKD